jgi:CHAT domain-containing protein
VDEVSMFKLAFISSFRFVRHLCRTVFGLSLLILAFSRSVDSQKTDPLLQEAVRLSWLGNWHNAGPLYEKAELVFKAQHKQREETYARIGRIRAERHSRSVEEISELLQAELKNPLVQFDPRLRLWCLAAKAAAELEIDVPSSKQHWAEVLEIASKLGENKWVTRAHGELGIIAFVQGDTGSAVRLVGGALVSALASGDYAEQVRLLSMLGTGYNEVHRYEESLWFFKHALSIAEKTRDIGFPYIAQEGRAAALSATGRTAEATAALKQILAVAVSQNQHEEEAETLTLLGENSIRQGDYELAKLYLSRANDIATNGNFYRPLAQALSDQAVIYREERDWSAAARVLTQELTVSRRLGDTYNLPKNLTGLAEVNAAQKKTRAAERLFKAAEDVMDGILVRADSRVASRAMTDLIRETYVEHFKLVVSRGQNTRAVHLIERLHTRSSESRISSRRDSERASGELKLLESEVTGIQLKLLQANNARERSALLDQLLQFERNLAYERNEVVHTEIVTRTASLAQIRSALHTDEELVEYVLDNPQSFAIVLTSKLAKIVTLPTGKSHISDLAAAYADHLKNDDNEAASELYKTLVQPIQPLTKPRLIICTDGVLSRVPFESLRDGSGKYLVESKIISYVPSGSTVWAERHLSRSEPGYRTLLAVGDVDYSHTVAQNKLRSLPLPAVISRGLEKLVASQIVNLPESRSEILSLQRALGWNSTLLLGDGATETAFKSQPLSEFGVIHLAVHAIPDAQYPERASLVLGTDSKGINDGLLQVREIMYLRLNADLVTLSACETGTSGEAGVISLGEAFLIAGAKAVVVSVWNVEDHSTTNLMKYFYTHLARGEDKSKALTEAKRDFLANNKARAPFYWAGFVLVGEGAESILGDPN